MIDFQALGTVRLRGHDGNELHSILARPKLLGLLAYLAAAGPRGLQRRDTLIGLFWPDVDQERGRRSLRQALYRLRASLGESAIVARGDEEVGLSETDFRCDVWDFEEAIDRGDPESGLELYRGDFLEGFYLSGLREFDGWVEGRRALLREKAATGALTLAEQEEDDPSRVGAWTRRAVRLAPLDEGVLRRSLSVLDRTGDRAGAVRTYQEFADRLTAELGIEPAPETQALAKEIRSRGPAGEAGKSDGGFERAADASIAPGAAAPAKRVRFTMALAGAAAMLLVVAIVWLSVQNREPVLDADRVLVAGLENQTGDPALAPLGFIALDWLTRGLQQTGAMRVIDARLMAADPLGFASGGSSGLARALNVARESGAGTLLAGAYYKQGDSVIFQVQLTEVETGELRHALDPVGGPMDTPLDVIEDLRQRVMSTLAALTRLDLRTIPVKPPKYDAYQEFMMGLLAAAQGNADAATTHGLRAAMLDTSFAAPLLLATGEMIGNGQYARADSVLATLSRKRERLSVLEQTALDGQQALLRGDLGAFVSAARRNEEFFGLNLDQVRGLLWLNRPREAVDLLARIDTTDALSGGRPEYWRLLHEASHMLGDYEEALAAGERARAKYPDSPTAALIGMETLGALGRTEELNSSIDEAIASPGLSEARVLEATLDAVYELRAHGHSNAAHAVLGDWLANVANRPAEERASPGARIRLAAGLYLAERWDEARAQLEGQTVEGPRGVEAVTLAAAVAARQGERQLAIAISEQLRDLDDRYLFGADEMARARIAAVLGEREQAVALLREAFARGLRHGIWLHRDVYFESLRDYAPFQDLLRPKG